MRAKTLRSEASDRQGSPHDAVATVLRPVVELLVRQVHDRVALRDRVRRDRNVAWSLERIPSDTIRLPSWLMSQTST